MTLLRVYEGDITALAVDAIVNAAAPGLGGGGGVSRAIHAAAGPALFDAAQALSPLRRGEAAATPGFGLPARFVIHAIGPVYIAGIAGEDETLARCYRACLEAALGQGARSLAFPAISTGAYRFPKDRAARIAVATIRAFVAERPDAFDEIIMCARSADNLAAWRAALEG
jgi:O-acetyl-ADP-ribose deacetylase